MCGRYTFTPDNSFYSRYDIDDKLNRLDSSYNVAPGAVMPIITNLDSKKLFFMKWGLTPKWMEGKNGPINARSETITEKPTFKNNFLQKRCLVPASGFYEWQKTITGKVPYYITLKKTSLFSFAGIFEEYINEENKNIQTYAIITTQPNKLMAEIHNRMPVILNESEEDTWLNNTTSQSDLLSLLDPYPDSEMITYPVSKDVNVPQNNYPELLSPNKATPGVE